jgi:hypothetical protein
LLPETIDDYVSEDKPVRVADAFFNGRDVGRRRLTPGSPYLRLAQAPCFMMEYLNSDKDP